MWWILGISVGDRVCNRAVHLAGITLSRHALACIDECRSGSTRTGFRQINTPIFLTTFATVLQARCLAELETWPMSEIRVAAQYEPRTSFVPASTVSVWHKRLHSSHSHSISRAIWGFKQQSQSSLRSEADGRCMYTICIIILHSRIRVSTPFTVFSQL